MNSNFFETIDTELKAYWFGFLMADGCVYHKDRHYEIILSLKNSDEEHVIKFREALGSDKKIYNQSGISKQLRIQSEKMFNDLCKLGCVPRKSLILKFPTIDTSLERHFIRGYFDGDGSVYLVSKKFLACKFIGTKEFLQQVMNILSSNNVSIRPIEPSCAGNVYHLRFQKKLDVKNIYEFLYYGHTISLKRKYDFFGGYYNSSNV